MKKTKPKKRLNTKKQKQKLLAELERIEGELRKLAERRARQEPLSLVADSSDYDDQPGDSAGAIFERERDLAVEENLQAQKEKVEAALAKIASRTYGKCDRCGAPIGIARLEALPWATFCIECQNQLDRQ